MNTESKNGMDAGTVETPEIKSGYDGSMLSEKIDLQRKDDGETAALFSDFDGTLFDGDIRKTFDFINRVHERGIPIVAVTGRAAEGLGEKVNELVAAYNQEHPDSKIGDVVFDAIIGAVGTEIYYSVATDDGISLVEDEEYGQSLVEHGFRRREIADKVSNILDNFVRDYPEYKLDYQTEFEEAEKAFLSGDENAAVQPMKVSLNFYARGEIELGFIRDKFEKAFPAQRVVICEAIVYTNQSTNPDTTKKYCLDILPVTKAEAVDYLSRKAGIDRGLVAGDSGNDITMLAESKNLNAVLVGGHNADAKSSIDSQILDDPDRKGRSFQTLPMADGTKKRVYIEKAREGGREASESIEHVAEVLYRARKIKEIREQINK